MKTLRSTLSPFCNLPVAFMVGFAILLVLSRALSPDTKAVTGLAITTIVLGGISHALRSGKAKLHGLEGLLLPLFALAAYAYWVSILLGITVQTATVFAYATCAVIAAFLIHSVALMKKKSRVLRSMETRNRQDVAI
jgi:hypothetical protein